MITGFLHDDLGGKGLEAVFAGPIVCRTCRADVSRASQ